MMKYLIGVKVFCWHALPFSNTMLMCSVYVKYFWTTWLIMYYVQCVTYAVAEIDCSEALRRDSAYVKPY